MHNSTHTIYLTKELLFFVKPRKKSSSFSVLSLKWDEGNIVDTFAKLKQDYAVSKLKLLLAEDLSYTTSFVCKAATNREEIRKQFEAYVPEDISEASWDYKVVLQKGSVTVIQAFAINAGTWHILTNAAKKNNISIAMAIPSSYVVAHHLPEGHPPALLIYPSKEESFAAVLVQNHVFGVVSLENTASTTETITQLLGLIQKLYKITPSLLLFPKSKDVPKYAKQFSEHFSKKGTIPHPLVILDRSMVDVGSDQKVLKLSSIQEKKNLGFWKIALGIVFFLGIAGSIWYVLNIQ